VKEGPQLRRDLLDDLAIALESRYDLTRTSYERVLRQRNALLRQCGGRLDADAALTLDVWDAKLAPVGEVLMAGRAHLVEVACPAVASAYASLAGADRPARITYRPDVEPGSLADRLQAVRTEDVRRGLTTVGPHRDELELSLGGTAVRTHGSQGEQRSFALALKLGGHQLVTSTVGEPPLLLLDDVFSELDPARCDALVANLPVGQTVLTSADRLPRAAVADVVYEVVEGTIRER
jgi:DNA replication and repair protein RecF